MSDKENAPGVASGGAIDAAGVASVPDAPILHQAGGNGKNPGPAPFDYAAWQTMQATVIAEYPDDKVRAAIEAAVARILVAANLGQAPERDRFELHTFAETLLPSKPIEWVIDSVLSVGSTACLYGHPGSKKTYSLFDAAVCVATGKPWLDMDVTQGAVLIVDEESGELRLQRRLSDIRRGHSAPGSAPIFWVTFAGFNLLDKDDLAELRIRVRQTGARLVIIDALIDVLPGADENSASDMNPAFHGLRMIAESERCAIVVIHHAGKAGGYRGSSAIKGAVDVLVLVASEPKSDDVTFTIEKTRDGEPFKFAAKIHFDTDAVYLTPTVVADKAEHYSKPERYVLDFLGQHGRSSIADIMARPDTCAPESARRAVYSLAAKKKVQRVDAGGQGASAEYELILDP